MITKYLHRFSAVVLGVLLLPGTIMVSTSTTAQAQQRRVIIVRRPVYRPWWGFRHWGYDRRFDYYSRYGHYIFDNSDKAYDQGYRDGRKTGSGDAEHRRTYNPQRSHYYQEAGFGNFGEVYRSGFLRGYADGFRA